MHLSLALLLVLQAQQGTYADSATAALVARARARHREQDAAVHDYRATLITRLEASAGQGGFARFLPLAVEEQESELSWQAPNDVKVVTLGRRYRTAFPGVEVNSSWTHPWFVPRFLGDSIRLLSSEDFPPRAAIHPLSAGAAAYYRYAIVDSVRLTLPGRSVRAIGVRFTPVRADASLVAGEVWLDAATAETVRLTMTFVGRRLWEGPIGPTARDTASAKRGEALADRILRVSADLEYGLYGERYWLPYRQTVTLDVRLPWLEDVAIPIAFVTSFRDVQVNTNPPIVFSAAPRDTTARRRGGGAAERSVHWCADTASVRVTAGPAGDGRRAASGGCVTAGRWPGGRYEVDVPPDSVLLAFRGWTDSLRLEPSAEVAARVEALRAAALSTLAHLPDSVSGRPRLAVAFDHLTDIWRYNRAEGASLGWGYQWRLGAPFLSVLARARYAFTDRRVQGAITLRREAPRSRLELAAFREMRDADPLAPGLTLANSLTAMWLARDDGDYVFVQGGEVRYRRPLGGTADLTLAARYGEESAPRRLAHSGLNDLLGGSGAFPPNAPVLAGRYAVARVEVVAGWRPVSWRTGLELTGGARTSGRGWLMATARAPLPWRLDLTAFGFAGAGGGDRLPQRDFALGGAVTLRGYPPDAFRGASAWAAAVDVALRRGAVNPVLFADAGQVAARGLRFGGVPAASVGVGLSLLRGLLRLDAARPLAPDARWRLTLAIAARR
jgi:hypothetical protein